MTIFELSVPGKKLGCQSNRLTKLYNVKEEHFSLRKLFQRISTAAQITPLILRFNWIGTTLSLLLGQLVLNWGTYNRRSTQEKAKVLVTADLQ